MVLTNPVESVFNEVAAHTIATRLVIVDGVAPRSFVFGGEIRAKETKIVAFIAEVVINHIQNYGESDFMRNVHKTAQSFRTAIAGLDSVRRNTIVAPVTHPGESGHRHQLDSGDAQLLEVW